MRLAVAIALALGWTAVGCEAAMPAVPVDAQAQQLADLSVDAAVPRAEAETATAATATDDVQTTGDAAADDAQIAMDAVADDAMIAMDAAAAEAPTAMDAATADFQLPNDAAPADQAATVDWWSAGEAVAPTPCTGNGPCNDGDLCTQIDVCAAGACLGVPIKCSDGNACTLDGCDSETGCKNSPAWLTCDDGNACTHSDTCVDGACSGSPVQCGNCAFGPCDPTKGCTQAQPDGTVCDKPPSNPCLLPGVCKGGACVTGGYKQCKSGSPCVSSYCTGEGYCTVAEGKGFCDDGDPCTVGSYCSSGSCKGGVPDACDDANPCTTDACTNNEICQNGVCKGVVFLVCDDNNPCTTETCAGNSCKVTILPDSHVCGTSSMCKSGNCTTVQCILDADCPKDCKCKGLSCKWPQWIEDGELPLQPGYTLGYHGFLDEFWSNGVSAGTVPAAWSWTRHKTNGVKVGAFEQNTIGGQPLSILRDIDGDKDTQKWFAVGCAAKACYVAGYASPGGPQLWSQAASFGGPDSAWGGVFVHAGKVWAVAEQPDNGAASPLYAYDRQTGQLLVETKIQHTLQNLRGARWYDGQLYTLKDGFAGGGSISVFHLTGAVFKFDYGTTVKSPNNSSMVVRGNRFCFSSFNDSQCFAMKVACQ